MIPGHRYSHFVGRRSSSGESQSASRLLVRPNTSKEEESVPRFKKLSPSLKKNNDSIETSKYGLAPETSTVISETSAGRVSRIELLKAMIVTVSSLALVLQYQRILGGYFIANAAVTLLFILLAEVTGLWVTSRQSYNPIKTYEQICIAASFVVWSLLMDNFVDNEAKYWQGIVIGGIILHQILLTYRGVYLSIVMAMDDDDTSFFCHSKRIDIVGDSLALAAFIIYLGVKNSLLHSALADILIQEAVFFCFWASLFRTVLRFTYCYQADVSIWKHCTSRFVYYLCNAVYLFTNTLFYYARYNLGHKQIPHLTSNIAGYLWVCWVAIVVSYVLDILLLHRKSKL